MDRAQLLRHFDTLAETPDAVAKLRNFVLHLAVRGILVQQNPADEPATELAKRITALGQRIAKEQKIKLPTPEVSIAEADKKYCLPKGWAWVKLGDLCIKLGAGSTPLGGKRVYQGSGIKFLRSQNVWNEGLYLDDVALIAPAVHKDMDSTCVEPGDVLLNITGASIGRCAVVPDDFDEANVSQHVAIVRLADKAIRQFIHLTIIAPDFQSQIMQVQVGVSREGLSMKNLKEFVIALPPLAEQRRIVAKVEELLVLCDELEARQAAAREQRTRLVRSAIDHLTTAKDESDFKKHSAFCILHSELLFDSVPALRQAILSLAVQGRLVEQSAKDEPAAAILNQCQRAAKRIGIETAEQSTPIGVDDSPFELPSGWAWARLRHLGYLLGGGTPSKSKPELWEGKLPWVSPKDMKVTHVQYAQDHISRKALDESAVKLIPPGSLLFVVRGMILIHSFPAAINKVEVTINQDMKALQPFVPECIEFLLLACRGFKPRMLDNVERSTHGTCKLVTEKVTEFVIGLPPLAEQQRIVAKVGELMRWCDTLEAGLNDAQTTATQLLDATLHQILSA